MVRKHKNIQKELETIINDDETLLLVLNVFSKYEESNLNLINKLKRSKTVEINKINGALKQTINAHSVITKELIPSATKRIMGSLLSNNTPKLQLHLNSLLWGLILGSLITLLIL
jgi:hypothetical protein